LQSSKRQLIDMNAKDFLRLGVPLGEVTRHGQDLVSNFTRGAAGARECFP
jgi:hypothetical protein